MHRKIIVRGQECREALLRGVKEVVALVGATIGPKGRNSIIYRKYKSPIITNDGVTIARHIYLNDPIEDLGAQVLVETAMKTNELAGDGTSTSVVIGGAIVENSFATLKKGGDGVLQGRIDAMDLFRSINASKDKVIEMLDGMKKKTTKKELTNIISTSLENEEFGKQIAEIIWKIGANGHIDVLDNWSTKYGIELDITEGMKFFGTFATPYAMTDFKRKEAVYKNAKVLVTNHHIESVPQLKKVIEALQKEGKRQLVVFSEKFSDDVLKAINGAMQAAAQGHNDVFKILPVKVPALTSEELEDLAVYCNAKFVDRKAGHELVETTLNDLGSVEKVIADMDEVIVMGGEGDASQRIEILQEQMEQEKDTMFKEKLRKRIASLSAGIGVIRVGASTEQERTYLKYKIEDAVYAAKAALEDGYVPGGGIALKQIAEKLGKDDPLYEALMAPYNRIQENAGGELEIADTVIDPVKVTKYAVQNAVSAASTLITTESAITEERETVLDLFEKQVRGQAEEDFRTYGENRGKKYDD